METIGLADLKKYWITFEQLLHRWNIKENLLASYCVCVDVSKGNPPLIPHFYQGEFPVPGGGTWKKLAKYEPEYKNSASYLNKSKTESQLVQEFLDSIADTKKDTIWFLLSSVEELERDDYSLAASAQHYQKTNQLQEVSAFTYVTLNNPIAFKEIFSLWVGEGLAGKVFSHNAAYVYSDDNLNSIRSVENQLATAVYNRELKTYHERETAGRRLFYEMPVSLAFPQAGDSDGLCANLIFMFHNPACPSIPSEPVYFDSTEVFRKFPFLTNGDSQGPLVAITPDPKLQCLGKCHADVTAEYGNQDEVERHIREWTGVLPRLSGAELTAARLAIEKWRGLSHRDAYRAALPGSCADGPKSFVSSKRSVAQRVAARLHLTMPDWRSGA